MKTNGLSFSWILYMLFFAVPFPIFIHYMTMEIDVEYSETTSIISYIFLAVSIILWFFLLKWLYKIWVKNILTQKRNYDNLVKNGTRIECNVEKNVLLKTDKESNKVMLITVSLLNFADEFITEVLSIIDTKPHENRFEKGNKLYLIVDPSLKSTPHLLLEGSQSNLNAIKVGIILSLYSIIVLAVLCYYVFSWYLEGDSKHWNFLSIFHPLVISPAFIHLFKSFFFGSISRKSLRVKYYGIRTTAKTIEVSQTGTQINDQPVVKFVLEYTDSSGKSRIGSLTKIVSLLDLASVKQPTMDIFYEKDNPENIALVSDFTE